MPQIRTDLAAIPAYVPGRATPGAIKLASNEAPEGPLPEAIAAATRTLEQGNLYPDMAAVALREELAARFHTTVNHVAVGCGSSALCQQTIQATCAPGDEVLFPWRSFEAYPILARVAGAVPVQVPLGPDHAIDLEALLAAITDRTRLVFLCTPNNPTGPALSESAVRGFLDAVPPHITVAIDEAYYEYNRIPDRVDGVALALARENVVSLRTFSKAYGLAGLRVGYLVGSPELVEATNKMAIPFGVSAPAQAAAIASLRAEATLLARTEEIVRRRNWVREKLTQLPGAPIVPLSEANFLWLPLGETATACAEWCAERAVLVRCFAGEGVRVSIGTAEHMTRWLGIIADFFASR